MYNKRTEHHKMTTEMQTNRHCTNNSKYSIHQKENIFSSETLLKTQFPTIMMILFSSIVWPRNLKPHAYKTTVCNIHKMKLVLCQYIWLRIWDSILVFDKATKQAFFSLLHFTFKQCFEYNPHKAYHMCGVIYISSLSRDVCSVTVMKRNR